MSLSTRILVGLGLGLSGGIVYSLIDLPALHLLPVLIEPVGTLWVNGIRMTVIPLLMSLLITAIAGQSNTGGVAQLGTKTIGLFVIMIICACLYTLLLAPFFLSLLDIDPADSKALLAVTHTEKISGTDLPPFRDWLVNLVPANPFRAMANNALLSLMVFTGLFAASLLHIAEPQRVLIVSFFEAIKDAMFVLIRWIMLLAPIGIFCLGVPLSGDAGCDRYKPTRLFHTDWLWSDLCYDPATLPNGRHIRTYTTAAVYQDSCTGSGDRFQHALVFGRPAGHFRRHQSLRYFR